MGVKRVSLFLLWGVTLLLHSVAFALPLTFTVDTLYSLDTIPPVGEKLDFKVTIHYQQEEGVERVPPNLVAFAFRFILPSPLTFTSDTISSLSCPLGVIATGRYPSTSRAATPCTHLTLVTDTQKEETTLAWIGSITTSHPGSVSVQIPVTVGAPKHPCEISAIRVHSSLRQRIEPAVEYDEHVLSSSTIFFVQENQQPLEPLSLRYLHFRTLFTHTTPHHTTPHPHQPHHTTPHHTTPHHTTPHHTTPHPTSNPTEIGTEGCLMMRNVEFLAGERNGGI